MSKRKLIKELKHWNEKSNEEVQKRRGPAVDQISLLLQAATPSRAAAPPSRQAERTEGAFSDPSLEQSLGYPGERLLVTLEVSNRVTHQRFC